MKNYDLFRDVKAYPETHKLARIYSAKIYGKDEVIRIERLANRIESTMLLLGMYIEYIESLGYELSHIIAYFHFHKPQLKALDLLYNSVIGMFYKLENDKPNILIF